MPYSVVDFAKSLRIDGCKIQQTPSLIFLCGGKTAKGEGGTYESARDYFNRHLKREKPTIAARVRLAEEVNEWFHQQDNAFPDLLELENYLAHLADITVLFVESPGSIAELGAFANSDDIRPKTLAVLNNWHESEGSFISDGPIRKLSNENEDHVHYYKWNPNDLYSDLTRAEFEELTNELVTFLEKIEADRPRQPSLKPTERGHALLLVADLIRMPGVATTSELLKCLNALGCIADPEVLKRYLWVLQSVGFVTVHRRSNQKFFLRTSEHPFIRYAYREGARFRDQYRVRTELRRGLGSIERSALTHALRDLTKGERRRG